MQFSAVLVMVHHPLLTLQVFDLMTIRPSTSSQLEQTEILRTQLCSVSSCQSEDGHSLDGTAAVDPVLRREFLDELQKVRQIPICERSRLPRIFVSSKIQKRIDDVNAIIDSLKDEPDMSEISYLLYTAAIQETCLKDDNSHTPTWRRRLDMKITPLRRAIFLLQEPRKGSSSILLLHELRLLRQRLSIAPSEARDVTINRLKMELQSKREKSRRLEKNRKRLRQNGLLQRDARLFYRDLRKQTIQITSPPSESGIEQYWGDILETEVCHNKSAFWLRRQIDGEMSQPAEQQWQPISDNEVTMCLRRMGNWKSPGSDQVYGFWVKRIICLHSDLTRNYNLLVQDPDSVPDWLSQGIITPIPKNNDTDQAKNYRPITCHSVFYKTLTSVIKQRIEGHLSQGNLMASEQKGCQQGFFGAKDHLLINKLLTEDCKARHKSLSMAWVDYQKAYDSVPHS